jgi:hypothetical protein
MMFEFEVMNLQGRGTLSNQAIHLYGIGPGSFLNEVIQATYLCVLYSSVYVWHTYLCTISSAHICSLVIVCIFDVPSLFIYCFPRSAIDC